MTTTLDLEAKAHGSRVLAEWAAARPGAPARMGLVSNHTSDSTLIMSSDPKITEFFGAGRSAAGMSVTPESAMRVSAVYRAVTLISGAIASLPLHIYRRTSGITERVEDSDLWFLLNEQPTDRYMAASHWEGVGANTQLRGDSFTFIGRSRSGQIRELVPLPWSSVVVERDQAAERNGVDRLKYYLQDGLRTWGADQDDMLHFPGFGFDGLRGKSVIQHAARNAAGAAMAMDEYSGKFFAGGAHPSIVLESPNKMSEPLIKDLQTSFAEKYSGVHNAHEKPLILTEGIKANTLSIDAQDSQLLEARKFQVVDIARAFGVPPHLIGETSAATSWGSGMEEQGKAFVIFTLNPHLNRIEQELNRKFFRRAGLYVEFNRDALLESNSEGQSKLFRAALGGPGQGPGYMSVDEIRRKKNLPPKGGRCDEVYFPPEKTASQPKEESDEEPKASATAA
ncbi:HK97 family phage portal protein [Variovorax boronicumulans]|uniref:HK97 family phage portal protein n=1 Tax=Variovorax boronicumulans TaxID=436515 RepID=A0AAW8CIW5_9BURK|nr:phage portal protein [Variovorax boronicumulans]MDP9891238.1 HK97 family phage portal protein [Variovorax boronicumulans]MDQ0051306.1 HK97 family phage portal protein [Variovorax boronicumulans]